ncbi:MAG: discoidin domain-containing protein [Polyangiaceae bacterium]|nr:discoidin domain-containing protein [Polyangiaceae bacterium]
MRTRVRRTAAFLLEPFLLAEAERRARSCPEARRTRGAELHRAAYGRYRVARELRSEDRTPAGLSLTREAFALAFAAHRVFAGAAADEALPTSPEAWDALVAGGADAEGLRLPKHLEAAAPILSATEPIAVDRLTPALVDTGREVAELVIEALLGMVEPRSPRAIVRARRRRIAAMGLVAALALAAAMARLLAPQNLAEGMAATASSRHPGTPDAQGVTDGVRNANYGVHTQTEASPWVVVDLGGTHRLREVVVYHRNDGYWDEILPVGLELSEDGATWRRVAERTARFTASHPWSQPLTDEPARYVRLARAERGYIAVNEIEAYGD